MNFKVKVKIATSVSKSHRIEMEVGGKFLKILLALSFPLVVQCSLLETEETSLSTSHSPLFYVSEIIKDWNRKHPETSQVVVINMVKKNTDVVDDVLRVIPKENSVAVVEQNRCKFIDNRKAEFVVIVTESAELVSCGKK
jgi:hypothetical protein